MTYNHKDYIEQAINSILAQQCSIDYEILIHDDCSSDDTYEIIEGFKKQYPDKIRVFREEERRFPVVGFNGMIFKYVVPLISSKYVAYCDGDDYWCDPTKLQKQYDFMESHPDYSMCFHCAYQLRNNNDLSSKWFIKDEGDITMADLINDKPGICVATSSIFLKSEVFVDYSNWRLKYPVEDLPMYMTAAMYGKIHRLKDIMCVYRQFATGSWSSQNKDNVDRLLSHQEKLIDAANLFDKETGYKYHNLVISHIEGCKFRIAYYSRDYKTMFSKQNKRFIKRLNFKERLSLKLQFRLPCLYNLLHKKG